MTYIPLEYHYNLRNFKYKGSNDSYTYEYLWSPMNDYLVEFFPTWVAPNLITLLTLLMVCAQHFVFMWPQTGEGVEDWKLLMMGVCIVLYQHLDTLDGKQARRTSKLSLDVENSSPLGMLFDHGSDSLITFMITSQLVKIIGITPNVAFLAYYALVLPNIFCAMWLQYAIGYFFLGRVNPIDEGLPFTSAMCILLIFVDRTVFLQLYGYFTFGQWILLTIFVGTVVMLYFAVLPIAQERIRPMGEILTPLWLFAVPAVLYLLVLCKNPQFFVEQYYYILYCTMLMWSHNSILIQVAHITKQTFTALNRATVAYVMLMLLYVGVGGMDGWWGLGFLVVQLLLFGEFVTMVLIEGSQILNISLFTVRNNKQQ